MGEKKAAAEGGSGAEGDGTPDGRLDSAAGQLRWKLTLLVTNIVSYLAWHHAAAGRIRTDQVGGVGLSELVMGYGMGKLVPLGANLASAIELLALGITTGAYLGIVYVLFRCLSASNHGGYAAKVANFLVTFLLVFWTLGWPMLGSITIAGVYSGPARTRSLLSEVKDPGLPPPLTPP